MEVAGEPFNSIPNIKLFMKNKTQLNCFLHECYKVLFIKIKTVIEETGKERKYSQSNQSYLTRMSPFYFPGAKMCGLTYEKDISVGVCYPS